MTIPLPPEIIAAVHRVEQAPDYREACPGRWRVFARDGVVVVELAEPDEGRPA